MDELSAFLIADELNESQRSGRSDETVAVGVPVGDGDTTGSRYLPDADSSVRLQGPREVKSAVRSSNVAGGVAYGAYTELALRLGFGRGRCPVLVPCGAWLVASI